MDASQLVPLVFLLVFVVFAASVARRIHRISKLLGDPEALARTIAEAVEEAHGDDGDAPRVDVHVHGSRVHSSAEGASRTAGSLPTSPGLPPPAFEPRGHRATVLWLVACTLAAAAWLVSQG